MKEGISIHLEPTVLTHLFGLPITNTLITTVVVSLLLIIGAYFLGRNLKLVPGKTQAAVEAMIEFPYSFVRETLEYNEKLIKWVFPLVMTIFLFVLTANWFGLLPIIGAIGIMDHDHFLPFFYPVNTDLNVTLALSVIALFAIEIAGIITLGALRYAGKFVNFKSPLAFAVGIIELFSELARLVSFSFRLFGNIFAGKVLILVVFSFIPLLVPVPLLGFELFVGFIQAAIFALLTLFFIKIAVAEPH
ncbi:MAG: F0F1 ATP synthase subunit A [Patescibacteria group bacterium UBA2103]